MQNEQLRATIIAAVVEIMVEAEDNDQHPGADYSLGTYLYGSESTVAEQEYIAALDRESGFEHGLLLADIRREFDAAQRASEPIGLTLACSCGECTECLTVTEVAPVAVARKITIAQCDLLEYAILHTHNKVDDNDQCHQDITKLLSLGLIDHDFMVNESGLQAIQQWYDALPCRSEYDHRRATINKIIDQYFASQKSLGTPRLTARPCTCNSNPELTCLCGDCYLCTWRANAAYGVHRQLFGGR